MLLKHLHLLLKISKITSSKGITSCTILKCKEGMMSKVTRPKAMSMARMIKIWVCPRVLVAAKDTQNSTRKVQLVLMGNQLRMLELKVLHSSYSVEAAKVQTWVVLPISNLKMIPWPTVHQYLKQEHHLHRRKRWKCQWAKWNRKTNWIWKRRCEVIHVMKRSFKRYKWFSLACALDITWTQISKKNHKFQISN